MSTSSTTHPSPRPKTHLFNLKPFVAWLKRLCTKHQPPDPLIMELVITPGMTRKEFTQLVAACFVGVDRPEKSFAPGIKIFNSLDPHLINLYWGGRPHTMIFGVRFRGEYHYPVEITLHPETSKFLHGAYRAIDTNDFTDFVGTHTLNMTPLKCRFSIGT